jgi:hypothetical protein
MDDTFSNDSFLRTLTSLEGQRRLLETRLDSLEQWKEFDIIQQDFFGRVPIHLMMRCISYRTKLTHIGHGRPYAGLWVGDYAAHGVEFLLFLQRSPSTLEAVKTYRRLTRPIEGILFRRSQYPTSISGMQ